MNILCCVCCVYVSNYVSSEEKMSKDLRKFESSKWNEE